MTEGKYIVYADGSAEVFSDNENHDAHAEYHGGTPVSAGLFQVRGEKVSTFHRSMTLNLNSDPADAEIIKPLLRTNTKGV